MSIRSEEPPRTRPDGLRCLERHVAREVYRVLMPRRTLEATSLKPLDIHRASRYGRADEQQCPAGRPRGPVVQNAGGGRPPAGTGPARTVLRNPGPPVSGPRRARRHACHGAAYCRIDVVWVGFRDGGRPYNL
ncbi:hypothetical protein GCM10018787_04540 [Streptomyces thermodiastaticus]|nr:hypothetical protein GCM10018787_04540 [Streptomyces thermodiastaticus]